MVDKVLSLGNGAELILSEPDGLYSNHRSLVVAEVLLDVFSNQGSSLSKSKSGSVMLDLGYGVYRAYYQIKIKRVLTALDAYTGAIRHIEGNPHLYDARLATKAIAVLNQAYKNELR